MQASIKTKPLGLRSVNSDKLVFLPPPFSSVYSNPLETKLLPSWPIYSWKMPSDEEKRQNPQEPPNGGARAWGVALGAFAAQMYVSTPANLYFRVSSI
jgi:hypothetical protein